MNASISQWSPVMLRIKDTLLENFVTFLELREKEEQTAQKQRYQQNLRLEQIECNRFCHRIDQALFYAELNYYKREDYFATLEELLEKDLLEKHRTFAAFTYHRYRLPDVRWYEFDEISPALRQWLFANAASFKDYNFSFSDFEEAFKEASYKLHQDTVVMMSD
jgi:hypothetical protein